MIISQSVLLPAPGAASSSVHVPVGGFPNVLTTYKLSKGLGITIEELLSGYNEYPSVAEAEPSYIADSLFGILSSNQTLKELVWRIVQCNALQLRTIGTMLTSWGIGFYDTNGNLSKLEG
jgi:hypothetical protein